MKKPFKKLTAWLCCMAMLISFIPATALPVFAEDASVTYTPVSDGTLDKTDFVSDQGVKLMANTTVSGKIGLGSGTFYLDLNGFTLSMSEAATTSNMFACSGSCNLTILDSSEAQTGTIQGIDNSANTRTLSDPNEGIIAVNSAAAVVTLQSGTIVGRKSPSGNSGAVRAQGGTFNMTGGKIIGGELANGSGGAIFCSTAGSVINITGGEISGNKALYGGAVYLSKGTLNIGGNAKITDNTATYYGGAVHTLTTETAVAVNITGGELSDNTAQRGGGVYIEAGSVTVSGTAKISGNEATKTDGGGVYVVGGSVTVSGNAQIVSNVALEYGGGIFVDKNTAVTVNGGTISGNEAARGGGIATKEGASTNATVTISGGLIENNVCVKRGSNSTRAANVYAYDSVLNITGGTIGEAINGTTVAAGVYNVEARNNTTMTISGNPVLTSIYPSTGDTIGNLTPGAKVKVDGTALTYDAADTTVAVSGSLYTYAGIKNTAFVDNEIKLTRNDALASGFSVPANGTMYTIDLNGFELTGSTAPFITVPAGAKLTIEDSKGGGKMQGITADKAMIYVSGDLVLESGLLTGHTSATTDNGVYGGAIRMDGNNSTFTMNGGEISGNTAYRGGAIATNESSNNGIIITINAGTITGNTAFQSSSSSESIYTQTGATLNINGGTVGYGTGNAAAGLWLRSTTVNITGAPKVYGMQVQGGCTLTITELADGAHIEETYGATATGDTSFVKEGNVYKYNAPAVIYNVTVGEVTNGTVTVDPAEGEAGTEVAVTATPADGYKLVAILVDGEAIEGASFTITGDHVVTATFEEDVLELPTTGAVQAGVYKLTKDVTLTGTLTIAKNAEVTIDLNGKTITGTTYPMIQSSGNLTITDSSAIGTPGSGNYTSGAIVGGTNATADVFGMIFVPGGTFTLAGGKLTGYQFTMSKDRGGAVAALYTGTTFKMTGGEITGNAGYNGGGVHVGYDATFEMSGGAIYNNTAAKTGGGVSAYKGGQFTVTGGTISNNTAVYGGGVYLGVGTYNNGTTSAFTMTGGTISGNTATGSSTTDGGGGLYVDNTTTAVISGTAAITNNTATYKHGGGVYVGEAGSFVMNNGTIDGNVAQGIGGGIYLHNDSGTYDVGNTITIKGGTISNNEAKGLKVNGGDDDTGGGAIGLENSSTGTVTIDGGTITGNKGDRGSAIYMGALTPAATLKINGGTITNNADAGNGDTYSGVYGQDQQFVVTGGTVDKFAVRSGSIAISGTPVISRLNIYGNGTGTIGGLESGASVTITGTALTVSDTSVVVNGKIYLCADDVDKALSADKFENGVYTLTEDTKVAVDLALESGKEYTVDLNGYTLTGDAAPFITVPAGVTLTITDTSAENTGKIQGLASANNAMIFVNGGTFNLEGGLLTGHTNNATNINGGAIRVAAGSVVTLSGGEISGNTAYRGGGVGTDDTNNNKDIQLTIEGTVVIKDNTGTNANANIYLYAQDVSKNNTVTISGGTLGGGTVNGAAANYNNNVVVRASTVEITGGTIEGLYTTTTRTEGVDAYCDLSISGAPRITAMQHVFSDEDDATKGTIGDLKPGARVVTKTSNSLNVLDDGTVSAQPMLYRFAGDVTTVLLVANSFGSDTKNYLNELGQFFGKEIDAAGLYVGSQSIRWHAQSLAESLRDEDLNGDGVVGDSRDRVDGGLYTCDGFTGNVTIPQVLDPGKGGKTWDYVVLQPGVQYVGYEGTYNSDIDFLMDYIKAVQPADTKILWSQTWAMDELSWSTQYDPDKPEQVEAGGKWVESSSYLTQFGGTQEAMYDAILRNTEKFIIGGSFGFDGWLPIGIAVQEMRNEYTDMSSLDTYLATRLTRDGFHLSYYAGRMIAGLVTMKTLFPDIDLDTLTTDDVAGMFKGNTEDHLKDEFVADDENVQMLIDAVMTAYGHAEAGTVPEYGDGTANKQFNPDAVMLESDEFVAVYKNVTECGQAAVNEMYATTGAGKIVIYKNGDEVGAIDEQWVNEKLELGLNDRYDIINAAIGAGSAPEYFIQADPQAPQLAAVGDELYLTFDVKVYGDAQNTITSKGVWLTTSTDGVTWTDPVQLADATAAYGLTDLSNDKLLVSVISGTDGSTDVLTLDPAAAEIVADRTDLVADAVDVAFAEVNGVVWALTSGGEVYRSTNDGADWTVTGIDAGAITSPDLVPLSTKGMYVTWGGEYESYTTSTGVVVFTSEKVLSKVWTIDNDDTTTYGWNNTEASVVAECAAPTIYNNATLTIAEPTTIITGTDTFSVRTKTYYTSGGELVSDTHGVVTLFVKNLALESSLAILFGTPKAAADSILGESGATAKFVHTDANGNLVKNHVVTLSEGDHADVAQNGTPIYKVPYTGITAKQMGESVSFALYDDNGRQITTLEKNSVLAYANEYLTKQEAKEETARTEKEKLFSTLLVDMLNYGAAAQVNFNYGVNKLVNADLSDTQKTWASDDLTEEEIEALDDGYYKEDGAQFVKNVALEDVVELVLKYTTTVGTYAEQVKNASYAMATYTDHYGDAQEERIELIDVIATVNKVDYPAKGVYVDCLAAADMRVLVTVKLYNADGTPITGTEVKYNIVNYAKAVYDGGASYEDSLHDLTMCMVKYGDAAYAYLHVNDA